jgi:glycosyltransferase involved in cell wall biosynthesis
MTKSLVSVIIPYYNDGEFIDEAIESVLAQTYQNVEIIVVNDGSTDLASQTKIQNYTKPKTTVIHQHNQGGAKARNTAFAHTKGQYILTLDADDKFAPTFIEKALAILIKQPQVGAVSCWVEIFGEKSFLWQLSGGNFKDFVEQNRAVSCALIRREVWEQVGGYREELRNAYEDWDFWLRVTKLGVSVYNIPEYLFLYRQKKSSSITQVHKDEATHHKNLMLLHKEDVLPILLDIIQEKNMLIHALQASKPYKTGKRILRILNFIPNLFKKNNTST